MIMKKNTPGCGELCGEHDECCSQDTHSEGTGCQSKFTAVIGAQCAAVGFNMKHDIDLATIPAAYAYTAWMGMDTDVGTLVVFPCMFCDGDIADDYFNAKLIFDIGSSGGEFCVTGQIRALFTVPTGCKIEQGEPYSSVGVTQTYRFVTFNITGCNPAGGFLHFCIDWRLQRKDCTGQCCGTTGSLSNFEIRYKCKDAGSGANVCCPACP